MTSAADTQLPGFGGAGTLRYATPVPTPAG